MQCPFGDCTLSFHAFGHVKPAHVLIEPLNAQWRVEIAFTTDWDIEHTVAAIYSDWQFIELKELRPLCRCGNRLGDFQTWRLCARRPVQPSGCGLCRNWRPISFSFRENRAGLHADQARREIHREAKQLKSRALLADDNFSACVDTYKVKDHPP